MDKLLVIDDETDVQYSFRRILEGEGMEIHGATSGEEGLRLIPKVKPDVVIMDVRMGGASGLETLRRLRQTDGKIPVILMTAYGTTQMAIEAMKLGAFDYLLKPFDVPKLKQIVAHAMKAAHAMRKVVSYQPLLESEDYDIGIIGRSEGMQDVFKLIGQLASSNATALITGASGTGKELVARAIYHHSQRSDRAFLAINCAALPESLLESELFGHEKGAFTGAINQRVGKFEQCHRGTLFLDEIGDMPLPTQAKILRVLQQGTFERVGGNESLKVDVRIIAATNRPLEQAVERREFREDLFYRLNVVRVHLPSLRERREDIPLLVNYFLRKLAEGQSQPPRAVTREAMEFLESYAWPGNVRELENVLCRASVVAKGETILPTDLAAEVRVPREPAPASPAPVGAEPAAVGDDIAGITRLLFQWARKHSELKVIPSVERALIVEAMRETKGNQVQASKLLGITRATLRKRIERFRIRREFSLEEPQV